MEHYEAIGMSTYRGAAELSPKQCMQFLLVFSCQGYSLVNTFWRALLAASAYITQTEQKVSAWPIFRCKRKMIVQQF